VSTVGLGMNTSSTDHFSSLCNRKTTILSHDRKEIVWPVGCIIAAVQYNVPATNTLTDVGQFSPEVYFSTMCKGIFNLSSDAYILLFEERCVQHGRSCATTTSLRLNGDGTEKV